ncbi:uncharacterized protein LOC143735287 [Siphateles boraxobius]|uniref:uncharacterized protein LOC143735287 n=1 Tax=Siphateles boraxobius TaxID=180520 RepID=UPI0040629C4E
MFGIFPTLCIFLLGVFGVGSDEVSVMEGDSVTLNTGVQTNQQYRIRWYFNDTRIAQINGDLSKICTDVQCNEGTERFRDRLKLDHQTGSLTITNTRNTDSGEYKLHISSSDSIKSFSVSVTEIAAKMNELKAISPKEGESITLDPAVARKSNYLMMWYFNDILIAEITGDQSQICTDVQCKERFRDRLKLDHQTGSLTITNTTNTHSGLYKLEIIRNNHSFSIRRIKSFSVTVTGVALSSAAIAGISVGVLLFVIGAAACVIYSRKKKRSVL